MSMDEDLKKEQRRLIIESTPRRENDDLYSRFVKEEKDGYKSGELVMIVGSGRQASDMARMHELLIRIQEDFKIAMVDMGEAGIKAGMAGKSLAEALKKLSIDKLEMPVIDLDMDFSKLERITLDSLTSLPLPNEYGGAFFDEAGPISKKAYKKLMKKAAKVEEVSHKQDQTDRWCNQWNHKIKRKL